jgi:hypothetical protein
MNEHWILPNDFSLSMSIIMWFFFFSLLIYWILNLNIELALCSWNKHNLDMVYHFCTLLHPICKHIQCFCIYIHEGHWSVIAFFFCCFCFHGTRVELRASSLLGRCLTTWATPPAPEDAFFMVLLLIFLVLYLSCFSIRVTQVS